ncbi:MAG: mannose-6-phosphate isomerase [Candidatus Hydrogenedentes bacterium]|nr:mannose-6-phosphate isomerase [Candidatus Hydrogenedentota bacterium]
MNGDHLGPIRFEEHYFERIWGGRRLESDLGKIIPPNVPIGEAWLISDHPSAESVVAEGPLAGNTLRQLLAADADTILGSRAKLNVHGRFPLLLKILDAADWLSVQVHPDDECAARLGEPDVGKTEMWHILQSEPNSELICGLDPAIDPDAFICAARDGRLDAMLPRFTVAPGDAVFVRAGTVHAIGGGILLAEIQQNSDLTYRIYDWNRVDVSGKGRELHLDKTRAATHFGSTHGGKQTPLELSDDSGADKREMLAACRYFAAERVQCTDTWRRITGKASFHIVLCIDGTASVEAGSGEAALSPGQACLIPGAVPEFSVESGCTVLDYYVPDLVQDVEAPLKAAGHSAESIGRLLS